MQRNEKQGIDMDRSVVLRRGNTVPCAAGGSAATASAGYGKPLFHGEQRRFGFAVLPAGYRGDYFRQAGGTGVSGGCGHRVEPERDYLYESG